jgi:small subunit ribosomal protein S8
MSFTDPIADALTRIRNGQKNGFDSVKIRNSKAVRALLCVLRDQGYIRGFEDTAVSPSVFEINVELKYADGLPVIEAIKRVSKPGRRVYSAISKLSKVRNGLGIKVLSTSRGVMTDVDARRLNVGGEVICQVV